MILPAYRRHRMRSAAREDATHGTYKVDHVLIEVLGERNGLDPERYHNHARWLSNQSGTAADEVREAIAERERAVAGGNHFPPWLIMILVLVASFAEAIGGAYLMSGFGLPDSQRIGLGIAFGAGLLAFTAFIAQRTSASSGERSLSRSLGTLLAMSAYSLVICAIVGARLVDLEGEENRMQAILQAIVLLVATAAPPWITEFLMRKRGASGQLHADLKDLRRRERETVRDRNVAQRSIGRVSDRSEAWDLEAHRLRAIYESEFISTRARLGLPPVSHASPSETGDANELPTPSFERRIS